MLSELDVSQASALNCDVGPLTNTYENAVANPPRERRGEDEAGFTEKPRNTASAN